MNESSNPSSVELTCQVLVDGEQKSVTFTMDFAQDTPLAVAKEMIEELHMEETHETLSDIMRQINAFRPPDGLLLPPAIKAEQAAAVAQAQAPVQVVPVPVPVPPVASQQVQAQQVQAQQAAQQQQAQQAQQAQQQQQQQQAEQIAQQQAAQQQAAQQQAAAQQQQAAQQQAAQQAVQ